MPLKHLSSKSGLAFLLLTSLLAVCYLAINLRHGWVPHDEGILGQAAERVLNGELPHRDFNEPYTGGLAFLDAAAFRLFGVNLMVLRYVLLVFFILWVPAVFAIFRELCPARIAAAAALFCVAWSVPNYPAAMPSWFCLFFATFAVMALLFYLRTNRSYWLFLSGLFGGCSFLVKTPGLFLVAGVLLFLVYREQTLSREFGGQVDRTLLFRAFTALALACFLIVLIRVVMPGGGPSEFLHFVFPGLTIVVYLLLHERLSGCSPSSDRFKRLFASCGPFLAGVASPIFLFLAYYWYHAALPQLVTSLFVLQLRRLHEARLSPPHWFFELCVIPLALFVLGKRAVDNRSGRWISALKILFAVLLLFAAFKSVTIFFLTLNSIRAATPLLVLCALAALYRREENPSSSPANQQIMLLLCVTAMCSLVQFPYAGPLYFCYYASFAFMTVAALLAEVRHLHSFNLYLAGAFFALFAILVFGPVSRAAFVLAKPLARPNTPLALPRGAGIRVPQHEADLYDALIPFVVRSSAGRPILAGPDCPEIYFLSALPNHTPFLFDFFERSAEYKNYVEGLLDRPEFIKVVVINDDPAFSTSHLAILRSLVSARFPQGRKFEKFEVFWRP
jgi:hypothetical protein